MVQFVFMEICSQSKHSAFKLGKLSGLWRILKTSAPNQSPDSKTCHQRYYYCCSKYWCQIWCPTWYSAILDTFNSGNTTLWRRFMCLPYPSEKKSAYLPACVTLGELAIVFLTLISRAKIGNGQCYSRAGEFSKFSNSPPKYNCLFFFLSQPYYRNPLKIPWKNIYIV